MNVSIFYFHPQWIVINYKIKDIAVIIDNDNKRSLCVPKDTRLQRVRGYHVYKAFNIQWTNKYISINTPVVIVRLYGSNHYCYMMKNEEAGFHFLK